jgi:hypothetical protein
MMDYPIKVYTKAKSRFLPHHTTQVSDIFIEDSFPLVQWFMLRHAM